MSENTPLPIVYNVNNSSNSVSILQFYRNATNDTGISLIVNSGSQQLLPNGSFNLTSTVGGMVSFKNQTTAVINKTGQYIHEATIQCYSTLPETGTIAVDIINENKDSISADAISTKNITPNSAEIINLTTLQSHQAGDELQLRFGGGVVPGGGNLTVNILSIKWIILEK